MDPTRNPNYLPSDQPGIKIRIPNQALSVYTYHNDSPPLAPADSTRRSSNSGDKIEDLRSNVGSHGSHGDIPTIPLLDLADALLLDNAEGSGSEDSSAVKDYQSMSSSFLSSASTSLSAPPPLLMVSPRSEYANNQPLHASPDSRPPPRLRISGEIPRSASITAIHREPDPEVSPEGNVISLPGHISSDDLSASARDDDVPIQANTLSEYEFPRHRLPTTLMDESMEPLVIVACGSFSPCTYLHLRIFEMAKDAIFEAGKYEILAGYYSPVADAYRKSGLAASHHRVRMCELAVENTSSWLMVDAWESLQSEYTRTADVLDHFDSKINGEGGVTLADGSKRRVKIMLLAGGDLIQSFGEPGVWSEPDLHRILGLYGCLVVERTGSDVWAFLLSHDILWMHRDNVHVIKQLIYNDISSTKVRLFVRRGMSLKYLMPTSVISYIENHNLYIAE